MKILKVWASWQEEIKYHDHYLAEAMHKKGYETTFLVPNKVDRSMRPFLKTASPPAGETVHPFHRVMRLRSIDFFGKFIVTDFRAAARVIDSSFDVVHFFGISNFITFLVLTLLRRKKTAPVVVINDHSHPDDHKTSLVARLYYGLFRHLFRLHAAQVDRIIVPNLPSLRYLKARYAISDDARFKMIPLGYQHEVFRHEPQKNNDVQPLVIGFAGKIYPEKCIEKLLRTVARLRGDCVRLIVAGINLDAPSDYQRSLLQQASSMELANVEFTKFITSPVELAAFYNYIDVAVFPGSVSITTIEASGCGTPVILYRSTEGLEDRVDQDRGVLFDTEPQLLEALRDFMARKKAGAIDRAGIAARSRRFAWDNVSELYIEEYRRVQELRKSAPRRACAG